jgi:uncharacterized protein YndB with AHSA1/START domain
MRLVTVHATISAPREEVFDLVADLSLRPAWGDHYQRDYRLARANPRGEGAAARFRLNLPFAHEWAEIEIKTADRPRRIVEEGGLGRRGRSKLVSVYDFMPESGGTTRVELTTFSEPGAFVDRIKHVASTGRMRRWSKKGLDRLRRILEEGQGEELARTTVAGYDPGKAPRFGDHIQAAHGVAGADR